MSSVRDRIFELQAYSSHEHVGSLNSIGISEPSCFTTDVMPHADGSGTRIMDLLHAPYLHGCLVSSGSAEEGAADWSGLTGQFRHIKNCGLWNALNIGVKSVYGISLDQAFQDKALYLELDQKIARAYSDLHAHYSRVCQLARLSKLLKPVHLQYFHAITPGFEEYDRFIPILRVDDLLGYITAEGIQWDHAERWLGLKIDSIENIDCMIEKTFDLIDAHGIRAIKQLQAYARPLLFKKESVGAVNHALRQSGWRNDPGAYYVVQNYIMHQILKKAAERRLPYQIHTGMANLPHSDPSLLSNVIGAYPEVNFVLLHGYPYHAQACYLASTHRNVYLDAAWLALLSPTVFQHALSEWLTMTPENKILLSADATSIEEMTGAYQVMRVCLSDLLDDEIQRGRMDTGRALETAQKLLAGNMRSLYGV